MGEPDSVYAAAGRLGAARRHGGDVDAARVALAEARANRLRSEADAIEAAALVASAGPPPPEEPT